MLIKRFLCCALLVGFVLGIRAASPVIGSLERQLDVDEMTKGRLLLGELNCSACHELGDSLRRIQSKPAPNLQDIGSRVHFDWLKGYSANPHASKPGTTMPHVLAGEDAGEREEISEAIAHYLVSLGANAQADESIKPGSAEDGRTLYHSIGCVACHSPEENVAGSIPLGDVDRKYQFSGLVEFLKDPLKVRPGGRMPRVPLRHDEALDVATYLLNGEIAEVSPPAPSSTLVSDGRKHFSEQGCIACHQVEDPLLGSEVPKFALNDLQSGCLSGEMRDWPSYSLSNEQIASIRSALSDSAADVTDEQQIRFAMLQLNCVACHDRNGLGGVDEARDTWFESHDPNIGEQGRVPPTLTAVGAKLNQVTLRKVLVEGAAVRPYMKTRMPQFGAKNVETLIDLFDNTDTIPEIEPVQVGRLHEFRNDGRKLVGNEAFTCIACHSFKGKKTGSMGVVDITEMGQRLDRNWFVAYMLNPQRFSPSTLMPGFWPGGKSSYEELYEGDGMKQIHAIWSYLEEGYGAGQPRGMQRDPMRLLATDHAQMLRRSYRGVGKRGIGVGYPEGVNMVFNAEQMCLSSLWKGEFLDPAGVWMSQGHGTARPLARPIELTNEPELNFLEKSDSEWPEAEDRPNHLLFKGYTLDDKRRPTFRYEVGNNSVNDFVSARGEEDGKAVLRRELTFRSTGSERSGLVFRVAVNEQVSAESMNLYKIAEGLWIRIVEGTGEIVPTTEGGSELRIPVAFSGGRGQVTIEYLW